MITIFGYNDKDGCKVIYDGEKLRWDDDKDNDNELKLSLIKISKSNFEPIEDQTIDIDSIEELWGNCVGDSNQCRDDFMLKNRAKINELVQAIKHLNKEIQSIKEK